MERGCEGKQGVCILRLLLAIELGYLLSTCRTANLLRFRVAFCALGRTRTCAHGSGGRCSIL